MGGRTGEKERVRRGGHLEAAGVAIVALVLTWFVACQAETERPVRVSRFVNESALLSSDLAEAFVPFEFDYPADWSPALLETYTERFLEHFDAFADVYRDLRCPEG